MQKDQQPVVSPEENDLRIRLTRQFPGTSCSSRFCENTALAVMRCARSGAFDPRPLMRECYRDFPCHRTDTAVFGADTRTPLKRCRFGYYYGEHPPFSDEQLARQRNGKNASIAQQKTSDVGKNKKSDYIVQKKKMTAEASAKIRKDAVEWAKNQIGSSAYSPDVKNEAWSKGSTKCNKFVIDAFNKSFNQEIIRQDIPTNLRKPILKRTSIDIGFDVSFSNHAPSAEDFYEGKVKGFVRTKFPQKGDIVTNGHHMGIISGKNKTISASSIDDKKIVENDWGFRIGQQVRFYRYWQWLE